MNFAFFGQIKKVEKRAQLYAQIELESNHWNDDAADYVDDIEDNDICMI